MEYNEIILNRLPKYISSLLGYIDRFSENYKITSHEVIIDDSDLGDIGSYVQSFSTCSYLITVKYILNGEDEREFTIEVPRMINGVFIIKGKYKMINRYLATDGICNLCGSYFNFRYHFSYNLNTELFLYTDEDGDYHELTFDELKRDFPELLKLTEQQKYKFKVLYDLDYLPTELDDKLVSLIQNKPVNPNHVINKKIVDIESTLFSVLYNSRLDIAKQCQHNFYTYGTISSSIIQSVINKVFYNHGDNLNTTNTSSNINPYSFNAVNTKIVIEDISEKGNRPQEFNETLMDIIDPIVTPDGPNINKLNYLNKSTSVIGSHFYIKCYDSKFTEVELPYFKYIGSKVLINEYVDYTTHEIKSPFKVRVNGKIKSSDTFDFIELHPDERLNLLTRAIPMINFTDTVRLGMAAKMITQAVPLLNPEEPIVQSGHESDIKDSVFTTKYMGNTVATVIEVTNEKVVLDVDGIPHEYQVNSPITGIYNLTTVFEPVVKVGDRVTPNQIIISDRNSTSGKINLGLNAFTAFMPYRGLNYEDGIIISESFADKLSYYTIQDVVYYVREFEEVVSILPKGTPIKTGDALLTLESSLRNNQLDKTINLMIKDSTIKRKIVQVPNNIEDGYILDVAFAYNDYVELVDGNKRLELDQESIDVLNNSLNTSIQLPNSIPNSYRRYITKKEVPEYEGNAACIVIKLLVKDKGRVGTKLSNLYGSKGLVSKVLPDDKMLRTKDGRVVDVIINSDSVFARKNLSQLPVMYLATIAKYIKSVGETEGIAKMKDLCSKYGLEQYAKLTDEELKAIINSNEPLRYITGSYSRFTTEQIISWMEELGVSEKCQLIDGKTNRPIRNPIICSDLYMIMLYKIPTHDNKVFTENSSGDPILGTGHLRDGGGMSLGEMENTGLLASDADEFIYKVRNKFAFHDAHNLYIDLAMAGLVVETEDDYKIEESSLRALRDKFNSR